MVQQPVQEAGQSKKGQYAIQLVIFAVLVAGGNLLGIRWLHQRTYASYKQGWVKLQQKDFEGAVADLNRAIEFNSRLSEAYLGRGFAKQARRDLEGAIADYSEAIRLNPKFKGTYYHRGLAKMDKGDVDGAIADYSKELEHDPKNAQVYNSRGDARLAEGDVVGATEDFGQAAKLAPAPQVKETASRDCFSGETIN